MAKNMAAGNFADSGRRARRGFTLIELMVVVAIIFFLAAIVIPNVMMGVERSRKARAQVAQEAKSRPEAPALAAGEQRQGGSLPTVESAEISVALRASHQRLGMGVYTRFQAAFDGTYQVSLAGKDNAPVVLDIPFPANTAEAREVSLLMGEGDARKEPDGVIFDRQGIFWRGVISGNAPVMAKASYVAQGRDRFELQMMPAARVKSLRLTLDLSGVPNFTIPDYALQPTERKGSLLTYQFGSLVTDRAVAVDFPVAESPLGRVILLSKLVAVAVLLFGAGFWYLSDLYKPGVLSRFRWGHFLLLAMTYSLFFVIFAVLGFQGETSLLTMLIISGALSFPLLVLHVGRVIDMRFALTRTLILALFTLGIVINGVYGENYRNYVFIGAAFVMIAFVTITYRKWSANRDDLLRSRMEGLNARLESLAPLVEEARKISGQTYHALLQSNNRHIESLRQDIEGDLKAMDIHLKGYEGILARQVSMEGLPDLGEKDVIRQELEEKVLLAREGIGFSIVRLQSQLERIGNGRDEAAEEGPGRIHCIACGRGMEESPFCPGCGTPQPVKMDCGRCGTSIRVPIHMSKKDVGSLSLHCPGCGAVNEKKG